jgi:hypothetical protein
MPAASRTAPTATVNSGIQRVIKITARAQSNDSTLNENAKGATEPTSDRTLSSGVSPGCSPCAKPATPIVAKASAGLNGSARGR